MTIQNILQKQTLVSPGWMYLLLFEYVQGWEGERPLYVHQTSIHWPPSHSFL